MTKGQWLGLQYILGGVAVIILVLVDKYFN
jgi:hypothetical protein